MTIESKVNNPCPSCGHQKEYPDKELCRYCYMRGSHGTMKFMILNILGNLPPETRLSIIDLMDALNNFRYIGYEMRRRDMRQRLLKMKRYGMVTASKDKIKKPMHLVEFKGELVKRRMGGRKKLYFRISRRGLIILNLYKKRWKRGFVIRATPRSERKMKKFKMTMDYKERAGSIRSKLKDIDDNNPDLYAYIFPQRQNKQEEKKGRLVPLKYPAKNDPVRIQKIKEGKERRKLKYGYKRKKK